MDTKPRQQSLSNFMKISITILVVVTLASISLLFIGDFEGKFERVFSTIALFAVFVLLTAFDTRKDQKNEWYAPVALIANAYILGLLLMVIWVTPYNQFSLQLEIIWKSTFVIVTTRVVTLALELLLNIGENRPRSLGKWGLATSIFGVITLILFTAPVGIEAFSVSIPQIYWKISVATLIVTALGLAITLLLSWYYRPVVEKQELLPWPTFADGSPYPQLADGQPDFSVEQSQQSLAPSVVAPPVAAPPVAAPPVAAHPPAVEQQFVARDEQDVSQDGHSLPLGEQGTPPQQH